jgi:1-acyl-sn-glycerol-3-phosphate acyltransferase
LNEVRGPVVFVANHSSHLDTPLILGSLPARFADRVAVGAAADYFFDTRWRAVTTALLFNAFPVERYGSRRLRSLASDLIDDGWSMLIYPEGTRSEDGWMNPFRVGAAYLCVTKGIPVVPIALCGSYAAMPRGRNWPKPGRPRITIRYGRPLYPVAGEKPGDFRRRMTEAVVRLAVEEQLGWYGALRAAAGGTLEVPGFRSALPSSPAPAAIAGPAQASADDDAVAANGADSSVPDGVESAANGGDSAAAGALVPVAGGAPALAPRGQEAARWRRIWTATSPAPRRPARRVWR